LSRAISVNESMRLSHDSAIKQQIGAQLIPSLKKSPDLVPREADAFWAVLSCPARQGEGELSRAYLGSRKDRPDVALQRMVWLLPNRPECRFKPIFS